MLAMVSMLISLLLRTLPLQKRWSLPARASRGRGDTRASILMGAASLRPRAPTYKVDPGGQRGSARAARVV